MIALSARTLIARKLCQAWLAGTLSIASVMPGGAGDASPTPVTRRCYIDCAGGCKILRGGTDAGAEEVYAPDRSAWHGVTEFLGWSGPSPTALDMLFKLQRDGRCPPPTDPNPSPCRLRFVRTEGFRGREAYFNVEAGERHRVLASRASGAETLSIVLRLRELGQCPNALTRLPAEISQAISTE